MRLSCVQWMPNQVSVVIVQVWILSSVLYCGTITRAQNVCNEPPHVPCGQVTISQESGHDTATYNCSFPYKLIGSNALICGTGTTLQWQTKDSSMQMPSCQLDCGAPPYELSARIIDSGYNNSTKAPWVTYECSPGYTPYYSVNSQTVACDPSNLTWEQPSLHCTANINYLVKEVTGDPTPISFDSSVLFDDNKETCFTVDDDYMALSPTFTFDFETTVELYDVKVFALNGPVDTDACGYGYNGTQTVTIDGKICNNWDVKNVGGINFGDPQLFPNDPVIPYNYCRRPQVSTRPFKSRESPWCFTHAASTDTAWGYCDVENCGIISIVIKQIYGVQESILWKRLNLLRLPYSNGKLFERRSYEPVWMATNLSVGFSVLGDDRSLTFCGIEIYGRPHQGHDIIPLIRPTPNSFSWRFGIKVVCSKIPSCKSEYQLNKVTEGSCNFTLGHCEVGAQIEYECNPGWNWVKGDKRITCQSDGTWSTLTLQCIENVSSPQPTQEISSTMIISSDDLSDFLVPFTQTVQLMPSTVSFSTTDDIPWSKSSILPLVRSYESLTFSPSVVFSPSYNINETGTTTDPLTQHTTSREVEIESNTTDFNVTSLASMQAVASGAFSAMNNSSDSGATYQTTVQPTSTMKENSTSTKQEYLPARKCACNCSVNDGGLSSVAQEDPPRTEVEEPLLLQKNFLSKKIRKVTSATDNRLSSRIIGTVFSFVAVFALIAVLVLADLVKIAKTQQEGKI